jgi:hypothetical protein
MPKVLDIVGNSYGNWTVLARAPNKSGSSVWYCICTCGVIKEVEGYCLVKGRTKSCGCISKAKIWNPIIVDDNTYSIPLTHGKIAYIDKEDYVKIKDFGWFLREGYAIARVGIRSNLTQVKSSHTWMHRVILGYFGDQEIDHIDCNGLNNRKSNLRLANRTQNTQNAVIRKDSTSGFKGVNYHKRNKRWRARIAVGKKRISLGCYTTKEEANDAVEKARKNLHGEFARSK